MIDALTHWSLVALAAVTVALFWRASRLERRRARRYVRRVK